MKFDRLFIECLWTDYSILFELFVEGYLIDVSSIGGAAYLLFVKSTSLRDCPPLAERLGYTRLLSTAPG